MSHAVRIVQLSEWRPLSVVQWLREVLGYQPKRVRAYCSVCGLGSRGNRITGFFMPCEWKHRYESFR